MSSQVIIDKAWGTGTMNGLYQSIRKLRKACGGKREEYIASCPFHLVKAPEPIFQIGVTSSPKGPTIWSPDRPERDTTNDLGAGGAGAHKPQGGLWFDSNSKTLWHMATSVFLPISETDLDMRTGNVGLLRRIEAPRDVLEEAVLERPELLMDRHVCEFLRDVWSHPKKYHSIMAGRPALKRWATIYGHRCLAASRILSGDSSRNSIARCSLWIFRHSCCPASPTKRLAAGGFLCRHFPNLSAFWR